MTHKETNENCSRCYAIFHGYTEEHTVGLLVY